MRKNPIDNMSILTRIFEGRRKSISFSEQEQYEEGSDHEENADGKNGIAPSTGSGGRVPYGGFYGTVLWEMT
jgi:hypothetical protein